MLTVTPPDVVVGSFSTTYPTPGKSTRVLGAGSITAVPFTTRFATFEPSVLLPSGVLLAMATTASAVINPSRMRTLPRGALLPASAGAVPSPVAMADASCAATHDAPLISLARARGRQPSPRHTAERGRRLIVR